MNLFTFIYLTKVQQNHFYIYNTLYCLGTDDTNVRFIGHLTAAHPDRHTFSTGDRSQVSQAYSEFLQSSM